MIGVIAWNYRKFDSANRDPQTAKTSFQMMVWSRSLIGRNSLSFFSIGRERYLTSVNSNTCLSPDRTGTSLSKND